MNSFLLERCGKVTEFHFPFHLSISKIALYDDKTKATIRGNIKVTLIYAESLILMLSFYQVLPVARMPSLQPYYSQFRRSQSIFFAICNFHDLSVCGSEVSRVVFV